MYSYLAMAKRPGVGRATATAHTTKEKRKRSAATGESMSAVKSVCNWEERARAPRTQIIVSPFSLDWRNLPCVRAG